MLSQKCTVSKLSKAVININLLMLLCLSNENLEKNVRKLKGKNIFFTHQRNFDQHALLYMLLTIT